MAHLSTKVRAWFLMPFEQNEMPQCAYKHTMRKCPLRYEYVTTKIWAYMQLSTKVQALWRIFFCPLRYENARICLLRYEHEIQVSHFTMSMCPLRHKYITTKIWAICNIQALWRICPLRYENAHICPLRYEHKIQVSHFTMSMCPLRHKYVTTKIWAICNCLLRYEHYGAFVH